MRPGTTRTPGVIWGGDLDLMVEAFLFDLDDTLLGNKMDLFLKAYFALLAEYVQPFMDGEAFLSELLFATQAMISSSGSTSSNREIFWSVFCQRTGLEQGNFEPFTKKFYEDRFQELETKTSCRPTARKLVEFAFERKKPVVIATNPLFPLRAIEQRLDWAGVPVTEFNYALVTSYENMHAAKPHTSYYQEILDMIGKNAGSVLMVGDDWDNDISPAKRLGMNTFWITDENKARLDRIDGPGGSLDTLYEKLQTGWLIT